MIISNADLVFHEFTGLVVIVIFSLSYGHKKLLHEGKFYGGS